MGVQFEINNPGPHARFLKGEEQKEAREGDAKYWASKYEEAAVRLTKLIEAGKIREDDGGIGQAAHEFSLFLQENKSTIRSKKLPELFLKYTMKSKSIFSDEFNAIVFLVKQFEGMKKTK